jgi:hypothetical protein
MLVNAVRGHLAAFGIVASRGLNKVKDLVAVIADENDGRRHRGNHRRLSAPQPAKPGVGAQNFRAEHGRHGAANQQAPETPIAAWYCEDPMRASGGQGILGWSQDLEENWDDTIR